jgi:hypothetical protein
MRAASDSKRILFTAPRDATEWLEHTARYNGSTISGEVVRSIRERQQRERAAAGEASQKPARAG